jgi:transcriptional regulator with XRE-family HTH domain
MITGAQIRGARALLQISASELASLSKVAASTIRRAERRDGVTNMTVANADAVKRALENSGVCFIPGEEGVSEPGVALKSGVRIVDRKNLQGGSPGNDGESNENRAAARWWIEHPDKLEALSSLSRAAILAEIRQDG